ncbi:MAG TPA: M14 metallopeptidase family protein [Gemmatimonadaceae bacterium]|nr:M14 metallopeptidase family protein [Gemmatimonadaceae bacterium]
MGTRASLRFLPPDTTVISFRSAPAALAAIVLLTAATSVSAQQRITTPRQQFGFDIGADYHLVNYEQMLAYWKKLDQQSNRMTLVRIGTTAEGRPMMMAIITSPENQKNLEHYRRISQQLALGRGLTPERAHALAREGKAVVWIDGGLHASEVLGSQQLIETVYEMVSRTDAETMRFLHDDILLAVLCNPDGMDLVSNWYNRQADTLKRSTSNLPRLYQKYVGHDDNRDFFMANQPETQAMNTVMYREWYPQIVYNHHQTGPAGTIMFSPPFRDPFNYHFDPLVPMELDLVGAAMHTRFLAHDMPGVTMRSGANYSTWWNGGLRTMPYFHNMIGLLTEAVGNPTPIRIPLVPDQQLPRGDLPMPIAPDSTWHFSQSIAYELTANRAVLDVASRYREHFLYNIYQMGANSIARGNRDSWTVTPDEVASLDTAVMRAREAERGTNGAGSAGSAGGTNTANGGGAGNATAEATARALSRPVPDSLFHVLREPAHRDPRGYIIPANQPDLPRAIKFVNILIKGGVEVQRATSAFTVNGTRYPAGSFVVQAAQAFRPHVLDMFEPQDYPNDFRYPGAPPTPPYDITGWTPALQMGIHFDRMLDRFTGPFIALRDTVVPPTGTITPVAHAVGYLLSHAVNNSVIVVNRLLKAGAAVYWLTQPLAANDSQYPAGTIYIPAATAAQPILTRAAAELGLSFTAIASAPENGLLELKPVRIGLWDEYGGSIPSGWMRWILDQYEFPYEVVYPPALDAGNLANRFDVLLFATGAIPRRDGAARGGFDRMPKAEDVPPEYRDWIGRVTVAKTVPQLRAFLEAGGTVLTIGSSTDLAYDLGLPVASALVQQGSDKPLTNEQFYIPGSVLMAQVDNRQPLAYGIPDSVAVLYDHSPAFRITANADSSAVRKVAWYGSAHPLRSGWAWGEQVLDQSVAIAQAKVGKGTLVMFGPEITFRGQPHGTFGFLFNGLYLGAAR